MCLQRRCHCYSPDWAILARVRAVDPLLDIVWDGLQCVWKVWRKSPRGEVVVYTICESDSTYRPLDDRVVTDLRMADAHARNQIQRARELEAKATWARNSKRRTLDDNIEYSTKPKGDLTRAFFGTHSFPSAAIPGGSES